MGRPRLVLSACCLALVLVMASVTSVNLALEDISVDLHASGSDLTWIADAYTVALAALVLPFGALGDDRGRRLTLVLGTVVFGIAAGLAALADSVGFLIACRAAMGVGAALIMPATLSSVTAVFPADERPHAVAVWAGFASAGAVLGLLMSGALLEISSWQSTFVAVAALAAVSLVATLVLVPNTNDSDESHPDPVGAALTAIGIGALVYGVIEGADAGWTSTKPVVAYVVAVVALLAWVIHDGRSSWPMLDPRLFRLRGLSAGAVTIVLLFLGSFGFFYVGLQYVQLVLGFGPLLAAVSFLPIAAVVMPLSAATPALSQRLGNKAVMAGGVVLMAAALGWMTQLDTASRYVDFLLPMLVFGSGLALASTPSTNVLVASLPPQKQGVASALNDVTRELGAALGIALLGSIFNTGYRDAVSGATTGLPRTTAALVNGSPATGVHVAADPRVAQAAPDLADQVKAAFMDGMHQAFVVGAVVLFVGLVYVVLRAPGRAAAPEERVARELAPAPAGVLRRDGAIPAYAPVGSPWVAVKAQIVRLAPPKPRRGELWPPPKPPFLHRRRRADEVPSG
jgi:EmrB/QacA subfamily drug resistance transporter